VTPPSRKEVPELKMRKMRSKRKKRKLKEKVLQNRKSRKILAEFLMMMAR
jgi:hypothetical protein